MNTPAHLLLGAAVMGRRGRPGLVWAALAGALLPDVSLYLMGGISLFVLGIAPERVFGELYFSDAWQAVFAVDNSVFVWGGLLGLAVWRKSGWAVALTGAALLHLALDFPLHHDDGRAHFWPLTRWVFESPLSYWDMRQGAAVVGPVELALALAAAGLVIWRRPGWAVVAVVVLLVGLELLAVSSWFFHVMT